MVTQEILAAQTSKPFPRLKHIKNVYASVLRILVQTQVPVQSRQPAVLRITIAPAKMATLEPVVAR
ncbi:unnamed protein product, partial [Didymodactylos carnosus]